MGGRHVFRNPCDGETCQVRAVLTDDRSIYVGRILYFMGLSGAYTGVILAHTLIGIPYMLRILVMNFESMPQDILDAGPWVRLKEVYLPMLLPSIVSGSIFTFINSMEEFTISFIMGLPAIKTLPTVLFSYPGEEFFRHGPRSYR